MGSCICGHANIMFCCLSRRGSPKIREEFHKFLEARGLNEEFANWVHDKLDDKAFQERLRLLEKVNAFIEAKD